MDLRNDHAEPYNGGIRLIPPEHTDYSSIADNVAVSHVPRDVIQ